MCLDMEMPRMKKPLNCYIDPDLHAWVDQWVASQPYGANKTALVEKLLREFREKEETTDKKK